MEDDAWRRLVKTINADVSGIIREQARKTLDEVHTALKEREQFPFEEDFIQADAFGHDPSKPRVFEIDGVEIQTRMLHRKGMKQTDIKGADLPYEIVDKKFVLIQYKKPDNRDRVTLDRRQLEDLMDACPNQCPPHTDDLEKTCGAWYAVRGTNNYSSYLPACKAHEIFGKADSRSLDQFDAGFSKDDFQRLFAGCKTGARVDPPVVFRLAKDIVLFVVSQRGILGQT